MDKMEAKKALEKVANFCKRYDCNIALTSYEIEALDVAIKTLDISIMDDIRKEKNL